MSHNHNNLCVCKTISSFNWFGLKLFSTRQSGWGTFSSCIVPRDAQKAYRTRRTAYFRLLCPLIRLKSFLSILSLRSLERLALAFVCLVGISVTGWILLQLYVVIAIINSSRTWVNAAPSTRGEFCWLFIVSNTYWCAFADNNVIRGNFGAAENNFNC